MTDHPIVTIYTGAGCTWCEAAKSTCNSLNIRYTEFDIGHLSPLEWKTLVGFVPRSVPQIFVGKEYIGGFTEFRSYLSAKGEAV